MRIRIDLKIFIFAIIFYLTKQIQIYTIVLLFAIIHELGHLLAGIVLKMKPEKIELMPFGLSISFKYEVKEYNKKIGKANLLELKKIWIALAGPLTNMIIIILSTFLKIDEMAKVIIIYTNFLILVFNLLPIYPLDGGRVLKGILQIFVGLRRSINYVYIVSNICIVIITIISIFILIKIKNFAIIVILSYLWYLCIKENKIYSRKQKLYKMIKENS